MTEITGLTLPRVIPITTVWTYHEPLPHTLLAYWLAMAWGTERFPGIETAPIQFTDSPRETPDGRAWIPWLMGGNLPLGIWGSLFDPTTLPPEKQATENPATLMLRHLDIAPAEVATLGPLLKMVQQGHRRRDDNDPAFHYVMKSFYDAEIPMEDTIFAAFRFFEASMGAQRAYLAARSEVGQLQTLEVDNGLGGVYRIGTIESDNRFARRVCLEGRRLDLFVQAYSSGHIRIFGHASFCLDDLWRDILISEHIASNGSDPSDEELASDATSVWRRDRNTNSIKNGTDTDRSTPATKCTLEKVLARIRVVISRRRYMLSVPHVQNQPSAPKGRPSTRHGRSPVS